MFDKFRNTIRTLDGLRPSPPEWTAKDIPDLTGKVALVTGGSSGLGKESCKQLLAHGATIYLGARDVKKAEAVIESIKSETGKTDIHFLRVDLGTVKDAVAAADEFLSKESRLDILMLNAGVFIPPTGSKTADGKYELQWGTNVVCQFAFAHRLMPLVVETAAKSAKNSVRVIWLSTSGHNMCPPVGIDFKDPNKYTGLDAYAQSKLGNVLLAVETARRYGPSNVLSYSIHPGYIQTELHRYSPAPNWFRSRVFATAENGALTQLYAATSAKVTEDPEFKNGGYLIPFARHGQASKLGQDGELAKKLWEYLEKELDQQ